MNQEGALPDTESVTNLILDFPASGMVRNRILLFKPPNLWYFCCNSLNGLRQYKRQKSKNTTVVQEKIYSDWES